MTTNAKWLIRLAVLATAATLLTTAGEPAWAATYAAPKPQVDWVTPGHTVAPAKAARFVGSLAPRGAGYSPPAPVWPAAGTFRAATAARPVGRNATRAVAAEVRFAGSPVSVRPVPADNRKPGHPVVGTPLPDQVEVFSHAAALAAGFDGTMVKLGGTGAVQVAVDYRGFAAAHGADWSSRLRLAVLPACALTTPALAACRGTVVPTRNDTAAGTVTGTVRGGTVVALAAGPSGGAGDFSATTLSPSGTWTAGDSSGTFTWNYPMRTPPPLNGPAPNLAVAYSSANVDGKMAASNNQPSWLGEGFDLNPGGYIERRYQSCADDMGTGANNATKTGDECWATDNATLSLGTHAGDLLVDPTDPNRWHLRDDDGTFVSHHTGNTGNGDNDGEWWVVTTTDGVQYWFGGTNSSNSTLTVPVAGNHAGEPCHAATFIASFCTQAWRWNLDHVVDRLGNTMTYVYAKETNRYARNLTPSDVVAYDRAAYLTRIDYGTTATGSGTAPMAVVFNTGDRCLSACTTHDAVHWPDTPWDQECTGNPCYESSPSYWTTRRLLSMTTELWNGTAYTPVTTWGFGQEFLDPQDGTRAGLVLDSISQTGYVGSTTTVPDLTFAYVKLNNRVDPAFTPDHSPAMNWARLAQVMTETGERIEVTYAPPNCVAGTAAMPDPNALQNNTLRCYPVRWTPPGYAAPIIDFFHKYVVQEVHEVDTVTPNNPTKVIRYEYVGTPAWHYTDDDGLVKAADRTWSVWRGYGDVRTTTGNGPDQSVTEKRYYRGMNGDYRPGGNLVATMPAVDMNGNGLTTDAVDVPATPDEDAYNGQTREQIAWNGATEVSAEVDVLRESAPTATRVINGFTVNARYTGVESSHTRTWLDGGRAPRTTATTRQFDAYGMVVSESKTGDEALPGDERCTLTDYDRNTDTATGNTWLVAYEARQRVFAVDCPHLDLAHIDRATVITDRETFYDSATSITTPPTAGLVTRTDVLQDWVAGAPVFATAATSTYDSYGRVATTTDPRGVTVTTTYTANAGGQLAATSQANSLGWAPSTTTIEPAFGVHLTDTDTNGRVTTQAYDGMGRLVKAWGPGRDATQTPTVAYAYTLRDNAPSVVTTTRLSPTGVLTSYDLYDGLLRPRQTQAPRGDGLAGTLLTDTFYDTAGRAWKTYQPYLATVTPGPNLFVANEQSDVPSRLEERFDASGRVTDEFNYVRDSTGVPVARAHTITAYGGDRTDVTPPTGGVATSTYTDVLGNRTAVRQYHGSTPTPGVAGSYDEATYKYDVRGQLSQITDPAGAVWTQAYTVDGHLADTVAPDRGETRYHYTAIGDMDTATDSRGGTLVYTYDGLGRRTGVYTGSVTPANRLDEWDYDGLPNSRGHLTKSVRYSGGGAYVKEVTGFTATYAATGLKYTIPAAETGLGGTFSYVFTYLPDGSPQTVRIPDVDGTGGLALETVTTDYNALGQISDLRSSLDSGTSYVSGVAYTGYGEIGAVSLKYKTNATTTLGRTYAEGTRLLSGLTVSRSVAPTTVSDLRMTYDAAGDTTGIADVTTGDNQCFRYDYAQRLVDAWSPAANDCSVAPASATLGGPAAYREHWSFDTAGNRAEQIQYGTAAGTRTTDYHYDAVQPHAVDSTTTTDSTGTATAAWHYDLAGDTDRRPSAAGTQTLTWDAEGRVATSTDTTGVTSYVYDADGQRLIRRDPTGSTLYLPDQELRYTAAGATKTCTRYYALGALVVATRTTAAVTWLANDPNGTTGVTVNATTAAYAIRRQDPYGNARGPVTGTWPASMDKGFVGGTMDNTGLTHLGVREYDPVLGRFASPDPVLHPDDLRHYDTYAYGLHNPFGFPDASGADPTGTGLQGADDAEFYEIGSPTFENIDKGAYTYHVRIDYYVLCRHGGAECLGRFAAPSGDVNLYWVPAWELYLAVCLGVPGVGFKVYAFVSWRKVQKGFIGPVAPVGAPVKTPDQGLNLTAPPPPDKKVCKFNDFGCGGDWATWWQQNGRWVTGTIALAAVGVCAAVTEGVCAGYVEPIAANLAIAGAALTMAADHPNGGASSDDIAEFFAGALWEYVGGSAVDGAAGALPKKAARALKIAYAGNEVIGQYGLPSADPTKLLISGGDDEPPTPLFTSAEFAGVDSVAQLVPRS